MASHLGNMEKFDESNEDWPTYYERLQQYFVFNDIGEEKQVSGLLNSMGSKTYSLLRDLCAPEKPSDKSLDFLNELLKNQLCPKPLVIAERFRFHKREQLISESVGEYYASLKNLSRNCEFGAFLNDALRDKFVCGIRNEHIQKHLLSQDKLNHTKALETAIAMETAARDAVELRGRKEGQTNKVRVQEKKTRPRNFDNSKATCYRCGNPGHSEDRCKFKEETCLFCHKKGHIRRVCRGRLNLQSSKQGKGGDGKPFRSKSNRTVHTVVEESDSDCDLGYVWKVGNSTNSDSMFVTPLVDGIPLKMELDTGAALSLLSYKDYQKYFHSRTLLDTDVVLKTFTGEKIHPLGKLQVAVQIDNSQAQLELTVVDKGGPTLFGRDWLRALEVDLGQVKMVSLDHVDRAPTVTQDAGTRLQSLLSKHSVIFEDSIGTLTAAKARLKLIDGAQPKFCKPRNLPYSLRPQVEAELDRLEAEGILSRVETSEWATPIVPVVKKSGQVRICGDFKVTVNPQLVVDQHPLPKIEDISANLAGGTKFSKIDLKNAYLQMEVEPGSKDLLTINTHKGLFRYNRLVFGIASAPAIWQRTIEQVLQNIPMTQCILDDMIVSGVSDCDHFQHLDTVLQRLEENGLRVNKGKCEFFKESIEYCGHIIDKDGLHKAPDKMQAIQDAPRPQDVSQVRSYLGFINYYHKFIPNLASVIHPLNRLLENSKKFEWSNACETAFMKSKELISSDQVLCHYDPEKPLRLASDASPYGVGAVLSHTFPDGSERPIAFASRSLNKAERNYSQIDKEALGIVWSVKKFHTYLYGRHFTLITDHQPLISIFSPEKSIPVMTAARLQRYALFLAGHNYTIEYRKTQLHGNADGLSRLPIQIQRSDDPDSAEVFYMNQIEVIPVTTDHIRNKTSKDPILSQVLELTLTGWPEKCLNHEMKQFFSRRHELTVYQGCLMWGQRVVIPPHYQKRCLDELHEGHIGVVRMKALARSYIWWPGIDNQIEQLTKMCKGCTETRSMSPSAPLHPWTFPTAPWKRIHIDFAGPFMGHMLFVVVDAHSKWPEVITMKSTSSEKTITALRDIFARNGIPDQVVSDNGPQFTSDEFKKFTKVNGIKHTFSAPYKPSTNGLAERFIQSLKNSLKSEKREMSMHHKIANFLLAYRNTTHATTGETPAIMMFGRKLKSRLDLLKPDVKAKVQSKQASMMYSGNARVLEQGQHVLIRSYREGEKWVSGTVFEQTGPLSYKVKCDNGTIARKHIDQLLDNSVSHVVMPQSDHVTTPDVSAVPDASRDQRVDVPVNVPSSPTQDNVNDCAVRTDCSITETEPSPARTRVNVAPAADVPSVSNTQRRYPVRQRCAPKRLDL